jgi:hypothetical protein
MGLAPITFKVLGWVLFLGGSRGSRCHQAVTLLGRTHGNLPARWARDFWDVYFESNCSSPSAEQVDDQDHQPNNQEQVDQTAADMQAETEKP